MNKLAVIDVGTNSVKTTLIEAVDGRPGPILMDDNSITRLGEGVDAQKRLAHFAMERSAETVAGFVEKLNSSGAAEVRVVGTSALRDAVNRDEFIAMVRDRTGITLEVIDGDREAALAYAAVRADAAVASRLQGKLLVFDIGGGSTELIVGKGLSPERKISLDIGAVRLTERFVRSDPPAQEEILEISHAAALRVEQEDWIREANLAVGIGGTVVTIAAVLLSSNPPDPELLHGTVLSVGGIHEALARFSAVSLVERRSISGLDPKRADVIIAGTLILLALLQACRLDELLVSTRGLRFGLLAEMAAGYRS